MKKSRFFRWFNLIEVTMAVAVVGIGIAGVMALFPPAIEANKSADFQNYTGTVVNNVAAYLNYQLKRNWSGFTSGLKVKNSATKPEVQTDTSTWAEVPNFNGLFVTTKPVESAARDWLGIKTQDGSIAAHVRIWKVTDDGQMSKGYFDKTEVAIPSGTRVRIVVELSWPIGQNYDNGKSPTSSEYKILRETQEFVYEFNKPEEPPAAPGD